MKYCFLYKPVSKTPLESIKEFQKENPEYSETKFSYAGRLDPMARGELLILVGEETKNQKHYLNLDKEYIFKVLLGVSTESGDILGKVDLNAGQSLEVETKEIMNICNEFSDKEFHWDYPFFSSKTVEGKPLFWWARNNLLKKIEVPKRKIKIYSLEFIHSMEYKNEGLNYLISKRIENLKGDFRQDELVSLWNNFFKENPRDYICLKFKAKVSSGTYIRTLAEEIGKSLGTKATTLDILRTKVFLG